jgi:hypothetical protein
MMHPDEARKTAKAIEELMKRENVDKLMNEIGKKNPSLDDLITREISLPERK